MDEQYWVTAWLKVMFFFLKNNRNCLSQASLRNDCRATLTLCGHCEYCSYLNNPWSKWANKKWTLLCVNRHVAKMLLFHEPPISKQPFHDLESHLLMNLVWCISQAKCVCHLLIIWTKNNSQSPERGRFAVTGFIHWSINKTNHTNDMHYYYDLNK